MDNVNKETGSNWHVLFLFFSLSLSLSQYALNDVKNIKIEQIKVLDGGFVSLHGGSSGYNLKKISIGTSKFIVFYSFWIHDSRVNAEE